MATRDKEPKPIEEKTAEELANVVLETEEIENTAVEYQEGDLLYPELLSKNFLTYAISVLTDRALPDVRDGLLPVQRRILLAMNDFHLSSKGSHRKCAKIVGDCFAAGTLVSTPRGEENIEDVQVGDEVFDGLGNITTVTSTYHNPPAPMVQVNFASGAVITSTPDQLFRVSTKQNETAWITAANLLDHHVMRQQALVLPAGTIDSMILATPDRVTAIEPVDEMYNYDIQVASEDHSFIAAGLVVHNCMGSYHPHGDAAIYGSLVRMAQDFSLRVPLVDGQGNFGNLDGDGAAAARYTECRLTPAAEALLTDLHPEVLPDDYGRNYDESKLEPHVLPASYPNLLVNGNIGIAVGMTCTVLPHNLGEVMDLAIWRLAHPEATLKQMIKRLPGPDFPTGAVALDNEGLQSSYATGSGKVICRGEAHIEAIEGNREKIVITSIPYGVSKGSSGGKGTGLLEVLNKKFSDGEYPEFVDMNDLSTEDIRIEIELKRGSNAKAVLARIYKYTNLQKTYGVAMNVLVGGRPQTVNLQQIIDHFLDFRRETLINIAKKRVAEIDIRLHKLEAYLKALSAIDAVVKTIKQSKDRQAAIPALRKLLTIDQQQAEWIVAMPLGSLTALDQFKLKEEEKQLQEEKKVLVKFIKTPALQTERMVADFKALKSALGSPRTSAIIQSNGSDPAEIAISEAPAEDCSLLISEKGYGLCGTGSLGGRGATLGLSAGDRLIVAANARTDQNWLIFSASGKAFRLRLAELPLESKKHGGVRLQELTGLEADDPIVAAFPMEERAGNAGFIYSSGSVKRTAWSEFTGVVSSGTVAASPKPGDRVVGVFDAPDNADIILLGDAGKAIRFPAGDVRSMGRSAAGVAGIKTGSIIGGAVANGTDTHLVVVSPSGYVKKISLDELPAQGRGGQGVTVWKHPPKYGDPAMMTVIGAGETVIERERKPTGLDWKKQPVSKRAAVPTKSGWADGVTGLIRLQ